MARTVKTLLREIDRRVSDLRGAKADARAAWLEPFPLGAHLEALLAVQQQEWASLSALGEALRLEAEAALAQIGAQQADVARLIADAAELRVVGKDSWIVPGRRPQWPDIRAHIEAEGRRQGLTDAQVRDAVRQAQGLSWATVMGGIEGAADHWSQELEDAATMRFRGLAAADLAEAIALLCTSSQGGAPGITMEAVEAMRAELGAAHERLRLALAAGTRVPMLAAARACGAYAKSRLPRLLRGAARSRVGSDTALALAIGDAIREALFARTAGRVAGWKAAWPLDSAPLKPWCAAAKKLRAGTAERRPRKTPLERIQRSPSTFDGRAIAVEGTVASIDIRHRAGKAYSNAVLTDATGARVQVGIAHIKIDSGGLVVGGSAAATGTFHARHKDFTGPVLLLERRTLTEDGRKFWTDWLRAELQSIFSPVPHGLTLNVSWVPGQRGAANFLRYGVWSTTATRSVL